jgi:predicted metal-dependent HD superfamily phosphohydrolase
MEESGAYRIFSTGQVFRNLVRYSVPMCEFHSEKQARSSTRTQQSRRAFASNHEAAQAVQWLHHSILGVR